MVVKSIPKVIQFVEVKPFDKSSRESELQIAKARSHAATEGHRRRREAASKSSTAPVTKAMIMKHMQRFRIESTLDDQKRRQSSLDDSSSEGQRTVAPLFSDYSCSTGLRIDPFYCVPGSRDKLVGRTLDFCVQVIFPRASILAAVFNIVDFYDYILSSLANRPAFFHAGIAVSQLLLDGLSSSGPTPSRMMLHHRGLALSHLRQSLIKNEAVLDPALICTMVYLALLDGALGNPQASKIHQTSIISAVSTSGGLEYLEHQRHAKALILQYDSFWALTSGWTMFPIERAAQVTAPPSPIWDARIMSMVGRLPEGLRDLANLGKLSSNTVEISYRASRACRLSSEVGQLSHWIGESTTPKYQDLLEACPCLFETESTSIGLDKLVLLTLILQTFLMEVAQVTVVLVGARTILTKQAFTYQPVDQAEDDLIVWVVFSAIEAWSLQDPGLKSPGASGLAILLRTKYPEVENFYSLRNILARFVGAPRESRQRLVHRTMMNSSIPQEDFSIS